jgi:hypothetical protein
MKSAKERAERSNKRAMEILMDALQESVGLAEELVVGSEFLPRIFEARDLFEVGDFFPLRS